MLSLCAGTCTCTSHVRMHLFSISRLPGVEVDEGYTIRADLNDIRGAPVYVDDELLLTAESSQLRFYDLAALPGLELGGVPVGRVRSVAPDGEGRFVAATLAGLFSVTAPCP